IDRTQGRFWHAGGSASQYYINSPDFRHRARAVRDIVVGADLLPPGACLTIIPTFCCELFATTAEGLAILEDIIREWRADLNKHREEFERALLDLRCTVDPFEVGRQAHAIIDREFLQSLDRAVSAFNVVDANRLPVAHVAYRRHSHYNKFGAAQS